MKNGMHLGYRRERESPNLDKAIMADKQIQHGHQVLEIVIRARKDEQLGKVNNILYLSYVQLHVDIGNILELKQPKHNICIAFHSIGPNANQTGRAVARGKYDEEIDNYYRDLKAGKVQGNSGKPVTDEKWNALGLPPGAGKPKPGQANNAGQANPAWASSFGNNQGAEGRAIGQGKKLP